MKTLLATLWLAGSLLPGQAAPLRALIIDGQNNHDWKATTPVIQKALEACGLFTVEVATTPEGNSPALAQFKPDFAKYKVIVMNYNGAMWSDATCKSFEKYMSDGGGMVLNSI